MSMHPDPDEISCWVPADNDLMRERYEKVGGTCGPSCIAADLGLMVGEVIERWRGIGLSAFKGYAPVGEMKETLGAFGYTWTSVRAGRAKKFPEPSTKVAVLRIQWLQEDGSDYYWRARGPNSHYVLMKRLDDGWWIFCNSWGWFRIDSEDAKKYLAYGYVSSFLELKR